MGGLCQLVTRWHGGQPVYFEASRGRAEMSDDHDEKRESHPFHDYTVIKAI